MAYFDETELVNYLRHLLAIEDDTGVSYKVLPQQQRRLKPGGIYGTINDSESDEELIDSPNLLDVLDASEEAANSAKLIDSNLLAKYQIYGRPNANYTTNGTEVTEKSDVVFQKISPIISPGTNTSLTTRLLASRKSSKNAKSPFDTFAKFEASALTPSSEYRTMMIVFPFCQPSPCVLPISIITKRTTLADLIGLSCYIYTREGRLPPCDDPSSYSLYLADETMQCDIDLPPQDRHRLVIDCGFSTLALIKNSNRKEIHSIRVFLADGRHTTFSTQTLDRPLQWLFDNAMEWKNKNVSSVVNPRNAAFFLDRKYTLESVEQPGVPLTLTNTISSTGCVDFVLIREKSSRSDLLSRPSERPIMGSSSLSQIAAAKGIFPNAELNFPSEVQSTSAVLSASSDSQMQAATSLRRDELHKLSCGSAAQDFGQVLGEYLMERKHRLKTRSSVKFVIYEHGFELHPVEVTARKKSFMRVASHKVKRVPWNIVASAEVSQPERENIRRSIRIVWLQIEKGNFLPSVNEHSNLVELNENLTEILESSSWKTIQLEMSNEDAWTIGLKLSDILDVQSTFVQRIYQHSYGARKSPRHAAEDVALSLAQAKEPQISSFNSLGKGRISPDGGSYVSDLASSSYTNSQSTASITGESSTTNASKPGKSTSRKISMNMRGMAFSRLFSKPN